MHPKITGSYITQSFTSNSNFTINNGTFSVNREFVSNLEDVEQMTDQEIEKAMKEELSFYY